MDPNQQPTPQPQTPPMPPAPTPPVAEQPQAPAAAPPEQPQAENPGKILGMISLITSLLGISLVGLILGIVGLKKSKNAGMKNGMALAGIILSIVGMVIGVILVIMLGLGTSSLVKKCQELGPGTHVENGVTYTCS